MSKDLSMKVFASGMRLQAASLVCFQPEAQTDFPTGAQD
jgi:hypothetical protein